MTLTAVALGLSLAFGLLALFAPNRAALRSRPIDNLDDIAFGLGFGRVRGRLQKRWSDAMLLELSGTPPHVACRVRWQPALPLEAGARAELHASDQLEFDANGLTLRQSSVFTLRAAQDLCADALRLAFEAQAADDARAARLADQQIASVWTEVASELGGRFDPNAFALIIGTALGTLHARMVWSKNGAQPVRRAELAYYYKRKLPSLQRLASAARELKPLTLTMLVSRAGIEARVQGSRAARVETLRQLLVALLTMAEELNFANDTVARGYRG